MLVPQKPCSEQQAPGAQTKPVSPPQAPLTSTGPVGVLVLVMLTVELGPEVAVGVVARLGRYQFASGSPRHWPTVTPRRPLSWMILMNSGVSTSPVFWWT